MCWCVLLVKFLLGVECVVDNNVSSVGASFMVLSVESGVLFLCLLSPLVCAMR